MISTALLVLSGCDTTGDEYDLESTADAATQLAKFQQSLANFTSQKTVDDLEGRHTLVTLTYTLTFNSNGVKQNEAIGVTPPEVDGVWSQYSYIFEQAASLSLSNRRYNERIGGSWPSGTYQDVEEASLTYAHGNVTEHLLLVKKEIDH